MEDKTSLALVVVLNELMDSDDEKPCRGKTRQWVKRRRESGYFTNIIQELKVEDRMGFKEMFRMDVVDFEYVLSQISDLISPQEINGGHSPVLCDGDLLLHYDILLFTNIIVSTKIKNKNCFDFHINSIRINIRML